MLLVIVFMLAACGSLGDRPGKKLTQIQRKHLRKDLERMRDDVAMDRIAYSPNLKHPARFCHKNHQSCYAVEFRHRFYSWNDHGVCLIWRGDYDQNVNENMVVLARDVFIEVSDSFSWGPDWGRQAYSLKEFKSPDLVLIRNCDPTLHAGLSSKYSQKNGILHMSDILGAMKESGYQVSQNRAPLFHSYLLDLTKHNLRLLYISAEKIPATPNRLFDAGQAKAVDSATEEAARQPPPYAMVLAWSGVVALLAMLGAVSLVRCTRAYQVSAAEVDDTVGHLMQENSAEAGRDGATGGFA